MPQNITKSTSFSRRDVLKLSAAGLATLALPRFAYSDEKKSKMPKLSLQLYSVRKACAEDFDRALEEVANMGFEGVEFAGYHSYSGKPEALKKRLDDLGLKAAGTHIRTHVLEGDELKKTIDFHKILDCKYLIIPGDGRFSKPEGNKELAEIFNKAAEILKPEGMQCGYHNHTHELQEYEGKTYWDWFAERTVEEVVLQQDMGWTVTAGHDPVALVRRYPGRSEIVHFKPAVVKGDQNKKAIIGQDSVPWKEIIIACREVGDTEWFTIEQEHYLPGKTPMECSEMSLEGLKKIIADLG
jgi:sugar phosphate isomerase/epimerase